MKRSFHILVATILLSGILVLYYVWQLWLPWFWPYFMFEYKHKLLGTIMLVPLFYSVIISRWRAPVVFWCVSILGILPVLVHYYPFNPISIIINVSMLLIPIAVIVTIGLKLELRSKQKNASEERQKDRQMYMRQIFRAQEDERRRIAQELHDDVIQTLMVIASNARSQIVTNNFKNISALRENLEWTENTSLRLAEEMRRMTLDLRPSILDTMGLVSGLNWLVDNFRSYHRIDARLEVNGEINSLKSEVDVVVFRIVQEALSNAGRHSRATLVNVIVDHTPGFIKLSIQDNGIGFTQLESMARYSYEGKIGLLGMQQRARSLGGTLNISTTVGMGTVILSQIPN